MSTHGCLRVRGPDDRVVMLHTRGDGMDIPWLVPQAFDVLARYYDVIWKKGWKHRPESFVPEHFVRGCMLAHGVLDRPLRADGAASLLIAAKPCFLEVVTTGSRRSLPSWSGLDAPYKLNITKGGLWRLYGEETRGEGEQPVPIAEYNVELEVARRMVTLGDSEGGVALHYEGELP